VRAETIQNTPSAVNSVRTVLYTSCDIVLVRYARNWRGNLVEEMIRYGEPQVFRSLVCDRYRSHGRSVCVGLVSEGLHACL